MKRARGVLVFVLVIVLLLSIPGATVFAQETVNDLGPVSSNPLNMPKSVLCVSMRYTN